MNRYILLLSFYMTAIVMIAGDCIAQSGSPAGGLQLRTDSMLTVSYRNQDLLTYQFNTLYPPKGEDTSYKRSGFIHPLRTLRGHLLTSIQPPDHYHHYGIWNPWTHTVFENDTIDFWNLKKKTGTVRFVKFTEKQSAPGHAAYTALHEHIAFKSDSTEKAALLEWQTVKVYTPSDKSYIIDIISTMQCASGSPLQLLTYRYGGFSWRAADYWNKNNCEVLTSAGNTRSNTDGSLARWCMAQGAFPGNEQGGMVILSHPDNYNHPEPLRIWDEAANDGNGDLFINFSPTKNRDWLLQPGQTYTLRYRLVVFDGKMTAAKAEEAWQAFAATDKPHSR